MVILVPRQALLYPPPSIRDLCKIQEQALTPCHHLVAQETDVMKPNQSQSELTRTRDIRVGQSQGLNMPFGPGTILLLQKEEEDQ